MTREEIRKLAGGYATGSLTPAERKLLFEAALEVQELFNELARDQALKELLDAPGARERLIAATQTPRDTRRRPIWMWLWWPLGTAAAAGLVLAVWMSRPVRTRLIGKTPTNAEVAVVTRPVPAPAPVQAVPAPPPPPEERPTVQRRARTVEPEPRPEPETKPSRAETARSSVSVRPLGALPTAPPPGVGGGIGPAGFRDGALPLVAPAKVAPPRFAFDYALDSNGQLKITPAAGGYLSVFATAEDQVRQTLTGPDSPVRAGSPVLLQVPVSARSLQIRLDAAPGLADQPFTLLEAPTGTVQAPNPSPDASLNVSIPVKPSQ